MAQIGRVVEESPQIIAMRKEMAEMKQMMRRRLAVDGDDGTGGNATTLFTPQNASLICQYLHTDGNTRRVPSTWTIPKLPIRQMYLYWHCGDITQNIPPMKYFQSSDLSFLNKRSKSNMSELKKVMGDIDSAAASRGFPPKRTMNHDEANTCYFHGESAFADFVPKTTPSGRPRDYAPQKWTYLVKFLYKKRVA
jgi:hypothetical protein